MDISSYFDQSWVGLKYKILAPASTNFNHLAEIIEDDGTSVVVKFPSGNCVSFNKSRFTGDVNRGTYPPDLAFGPGMPGWVERPVPEDAALIPSGHGYSLRWETPTEESLKIQDSQGEIRPPMIGKKVTAVFLPEETLTRDWTGMIYKIVATNLPTVGQVVRVLGDNGVVLTLLFADGITRHLDKVGLRHRLNEGDVIRLVQAPPWEDMPRPPMIGSRKVNAETPKFHWVRLPREPGYEDWHLFGGRQHQNGPEDLRGTIQPLVTGEIWGRTWEKFSLATGKFVSLDEAVKFIYASLDITSADVSGEEPHTAEPAPRPPMIGKKITAQVPLELPGWTFTSETRLSFPRYEKRIGDYFLTISARVGFVNWYLRSVSNDLVAEGTADNITDAHAEILHALDADRGFVERDENTPFPPLLGKTAQTYERMMPDRKDYWNPQYPTPRKRPNTKTDDADLFPPIVETDTEDTPVGTGKTGPTVNPGGEVPGTAESDHYERTPGETRVVRKGGSPPRGMAPFLQECLDEMGVNYRVSDFDWALQENYSLQRFLQISGSTKAAWVSLYKKHPAPESGAIWVVEFDGEIEVIDGNHRIGEALSKGKESIPAYVGVLKSVRKAQVTNWLGRVYYLSLSSEVLKQVILVNPPNENGVVQLKVRRLDGQETFGTTTMTLDRLLQAGELTLVDKDVPLPETPPFPPMLGSLREAQRGYAWYNVANGRAWHLRGPGSPHDFAEIFKRSEERGGGYLAEVWDVREENFNITSKGEFPNLSQAMDWCVRVSKEEGHIPSDAVVLSTPLSQGEPLPGEDFPRPPMIGSLHKAQLELFAQTPKKYVWEELHSGSPQRFWRLDLPGEYDSVAEVVPVYGGGSREVAEWDAQVWRPRTLDGSPRSVKLVSQTFPLDDVAWAMQWCVENAKAQGVIPPDAEIGGYELPPRPPMHGKKVKAQHLPGGVSIEDIEGEIDAGWVPRAGARLQQDLDIMVGERPYHAEAVFEVRTDHWHARVDPPEGEWTGGTFASRDAAEDFCRDEILNAIRGDFGIEPVPRPIEEPSPRPPMLGKRTAQIPRGFMWLSSGVRDSWVLRDTTEFESDWRVTVMPERETGGFRWTVYKKNSADVQAKGEASDLDQAAQRVYTILGISEADLVTGVRPGKPELIRDEQGEVRPPMIGSLKTATIGEWIQVEAGEKYAMSGRHHTAWVKKITERGWAWKVSNHSTPSSSARILASGSEETMGAALFKAQEALVRLENAEPAPFPPMLGKKTTAQNPPRRIPSMTDNLVGLVYRNNLLGVEYIVTADGVVSGRPTVYMKVFHTEGEQAPGLGVPEHKETFIKGFEGTSPARSVVKMPQEASPPAPEPPPRPPMLGKKVEAQVRRWEDTGVNTFVLQGKNDHVAFLYAIPGSTPSAKVLFLPRANPSNQRLLWQGTDPRDGGAYHLAKAAELYMKAQGLLEEDVVIEPPELTPFPPLLGSQKTAQEDVWEYPIQSVPPRILQVSSDTGTWQVDESQGTNLHAEVLASRDGTMVGAVWDGPYPGHVAAELWRHTATGFIPWYANTHMNGTREETKHAVEVWVGARGPSRPDTPGEEPSPFPPLFGSQKTAQNEGYFWEKTSVWRLREVLPGNRTDWRATLQETHTGFYQWHTYLPDSAILKEHGLAQTIEQATQEVYASLDIDEARDLLTDDRPTVSGRKPSEPFPPLLGKKGPVPSDEAQQYAVLGVTPS